MAHGRSPHSYRLGHKVLRFETEAKATAAWNNDPVIRQATPEEREQFGIKGRPEMKFIEALDADIDPKNALKSCEADTTADITKERLKKCLAGQLSVKEIAAGFSTSEANIYQYLNRLGLKAPSKITQNASAKTVPEPAKSKEVPAVKEKPLTVDIAVQFVLSELQKKETVLSEKITALMAEVDSLNTEAKNIEAARSALGKLVG